VEQGALQFDGWTVDRVSGEISRDGHRTRLPQQPLRILIKLTDRAGEVITREQLIKALWPQGVVDFDNGLNVAVRKLRVAFDDVGDTARYVETLPRVGYRFIGRLGYSAMWHAQQGRVEEGLADMRRARALEPMTLLLSSNYALILFNARRYDEVIALLVPIIEANPGFDTGRSVLGRAFTATGRFDEALAQLQARKEVGAWQGDLGVLYAKMGRREDALREIARLDTLQRRGFGESYELATIRATLGQLDPGCESLARALTDGSFLVNWMRLDPRMDPLRGRKCFTDVEKRLYGD
jgi:DNA-binding winged helix-turn-helix (wHTH) protein